MMCTPCGTLWLLDRFKLRYLHFHEEHGAGDGSLLVGNKTDTHLNTQIQMHNLNINI